LETGKTLASIVEEITAVQETVDSLLLVLDQQAKDSS